MQLALASVGPSDCTSRGCQPEGVADGQASTCSVQEPSIMPPFRSRSEARKGSGTATSGKKAAQQRQAVKDTPVHSALNSDAPGQGPTYQCGAYLRDLNDDEKKKVANLIQQVRFHPNPACLLLTSSLIGQMPRR